MQSESEEGDADVEDDENGNENVVEVDADMVHNLDDDSDGQTDLNDAAMRVFSKVKSINPSNGN